MLSSRDGRDGEPYWVEPGRLLAGPYPAHYDALGTERNLRALIRRGIRAVYSLMEAREDGAEGGRSPYVALLERAARAHGAEVEWRRFAIHDMSVPDVATMDAIQAAIDGSIERDRPVYVHCWRGRGRTGLVVGAYLVRRGLATADDFVEVIARLRGAGPADGPSPETGAQVEFVRRYAERC